MKRNPLPNPLRNPSEWGKWLLSAGLLLITVLGFYQLYEVQVVFFPEKYQEIEIKLMHQEFCKIDKNLKKLLLKIHYLQELNAAGRQMPSDPVDGFSSRAFASTSNIAAPPQPARVWQAALHEAKKTRGYVAAKLIQMDVILTSLQRSLMSNDAAPASIRPERQKLLAQIRQIRERYKIYQGDLKKLSRKLNNLVDSYETSHASN
ncbi:MAG: hypothetical protein P8168_05965 [Deltaproteobacteria bacterium]